MKKFATNEVEEDEEECEGCSCDQQQENMTLQEALEQVDIFTRSIYIRTAIDQNVCAQVTDVIRYYNLLDDESQIPKEERQPILLYISSVGGEVFCGTNVVNVIQNSVTPIHTIIEGEAESMALYIAMVGHKRFCFSGSIGLMHSVSVGGLGGKIVNVYEYSEFVKKYESVKLKQLVLEKTKITSEVYDEKHHNEWFMMAEEMLELGIVDEIIG